MMEEISIVIYCSDDYDDEQGGRCNNAMQCDPAHDSIAPPMKEWSVSRAFILAITALDVDLPKVAGMRSYSSIKQS